MKPRTADKVPTSGATKTKRRTGARIPAAAQRRTPPVLDRAELTDRAIARRAYELYEAHGRRDGAHVQHWLEAEYELRQKRASADAASR